MFQIILYVLLGILVFLVALVTVIKVVSRKLPYYFLKNPPSGVIVPPEHVEAAKMCFDEARKRNGRVMKYDLTAPIVMYFVTKKLPWEANKLPEKWKKYDNDVSINGDREEYWALDYQGDCYYAPGQHPRSAKARYMWLGWRNRASAASIDEGHMYTEGEYQDAEHWGDSKTGRDHEGWCLNRRGPVYQLYVIKKFGPLCYRLNYGFKVWANEGDHRPVAMVVAIGFSILKWNGE